MWPFSGMSLETASSVGTFANWSLLASLLFGVVSTFVIIQTTNVKEAHWDSSRQAAELRVAELKTEAAKANERVALAEERILHERRLTANERWRLQRVERAVLPRSISQQQANELVNALRGKTAHLDLLIVDRPEPLMFAMQLMQIFSAAGIETHTLSLARDSRQTGVVMWVVNDEGSEISRILWQRAKIGGGELRKAKPISLETLPDEQNCLVIGENDAALSPGDGQPGEGLDMHGEPAPAPE